MIESIDILVPLPTPSDLFSDSPSFLAYISFSKNEIAIGLLLLSNITF